MKKPNPKQQRLMQRKRELRQRKRQTTQRRLLDLLKQAAEFQKPPQK